MREGVLNGWQRHSRSRSWNILKERRKEVQAEKTGPGKNERKERRQMERENDGRDRKEASQNDAADKDAIEKGIHRCQKQQAVLLGSSHPKLGDEQSPTDQAPVKDSQELVVRIGSSAGGAGCSVATEWHLDTRTRLAELLAMQKGKRELIILEEDRV